MYLIAVSGHKGTAVDLRTVPGIKNQMYSITVLGQTGPIVYHSVRTNSDRFIYQSKRDQLYLIAALGKRDHLYISFLCEGKGIQLYISLPC